jgi:hypothetical protein
VHPKRSRGLAGQVFEYDGVLILQLIINSKASDFSLVLPAKELNPSYTGAENRAILISITSISTMSTGDGTTVTSDGEIGERIRSQY